MSKATNKFKRMCEIYKRFASSYKTADFSDDAIEEMFAWESMGKGDLRFDVFNSRGKLNGYSVGKHWMDVTVAMWIEDIQKCMLFLNELLEDYPEWFLRKVLPNKFFVQNDNRKKYIENLNSSTTH